MGSEQQAKDLLSLIDKSVDELDVLDNRLTKYDECLKVRFSSLLLLRRQEGFSRCIIACINNFIVCIPESK